MQVKPVRGAGARPRKALQAGKWVCYVRGPQGAWVVSSSKATGSDLCSRSDGKAGRDGGLGLERIIATLPFTLL